ncbi:MAG: hypothetical protein ACOZNI_31905, partial [Myxococcota bacterium]
LRVPRPRRRSVPVWLLLPIVAGLLVWLRPARVDLPLEADAAAEVGPVRLDWDGKGHAGGTVRDLHVAWEVGTLAVDLDPGSADLEVVTDEASVRVVGTVFTVTRDALGTTVAVQQGKVAVACAGQAPFTLTGEASCPPTRAAGMLGRARRLLVTGAPTGEVLAAVDRGLALAEAGDPVRGELVALRIEALVGASRFDEALAAAEAYLASGETARRDEVAALAERLRGVR